ncbi:MAG: immunoglobulin domain-containing protein [Akkermansiaceae bacterium]|nr:immunoglobulin domain-containing protein [Akkermansiaceae bacterium]
MISLSDPGATPGTGVYVIAAQTTSGLFTVPEDFSSVTSVPVTGLSNTGQSIVFAEGVFVVATAGGRIFTSPDGTAWTERTTPFASSTINNMFHDGNSFVAVGAQGGNAMIIKSPDGITWSVPTTFSTSGATSNTLQTIAQGDGIWVAVGPGRDVFTSGTSSATPPAIAPLPAATSATVGGDVTIAATVTGTPAPTTFQWRKNGLTLTNGLTTTGSTISGADTASLTISGATLSDTASYELFVENIVTFAISEPTQLLVSSSAGGAVLTPFGRNNTIGGELISSSSPAKTMVGISSPTTFSAAGGIRNLPNVPASYQYYGAGNPSGTKILLGNQFALAPLCVYDLATETATFLPDITFPLGPVASAFTVLPSALADNGDAAGVITGPGTQPYAFHYTAATQTYRVLGNVPNAGNEIATTIGGISADGSTLSGYERNGVFDGAFVWDTTDGFTLLPVPSNGLAANGDIRQISSNGRFIVGYGTASGGAGSGQTAMRWDLSGGAPVGFALQKRFTDSFADARWVTNDGTTVGNVRFGSSFNNNRAAVWLPNGALVVLPDYLASRYGLSTPGFTLNQVTSISADRRTLVGTATNGSGFVEGWILTLPDAVEIVSPEQNVAVRVNSVGFNGGSQAFGTIQIGSGIYPEVMCYISNSGTSALDITSASITGANPADYEIINAPASGLSGNYGVNDIREFKIRFNPKAGAAGPRTAALTVVSDDPDTPSYVINLTGSATAPPSATPAETALASYLSNASVPVNERGPLDDPDNDGVNNLLEFALGLPPMSFSPQPTSVNDGGMLSLTYTRAQQTHVTYTVTVSSDLGGSDPWSSAGVTQGTPDANGVTTATIPVIATPRFIRIEVSLTP